MMIQKRIHRVPKVREYHEHRDHRTDGKDSGKIKVCYLGGMGEITRNMSFIEYKGKILIMDCGLRFPEDDMPGIDFLIPNTTYLKQNKHKIAGMLISHGHYDHLGAIPYVIQDIGNPTIYTAPLTRAMILKRQEDFRNQPKLDIETIDMANLTPLQIGPFKVYPFRVNHNIPDTLGFAVETSEGLIFYVPDFKIDFNPVIDPSADLGFISRIASKGALLLMSDSTNAEQPGRSPSESSVADDLERIFEKAPGRIIIGTFASLISRVQQIIWLSEKMGRKVVLEGYSMKNNVEIARALGYLQVNKGTLISPQEAQGLLNKQITILCTGSQGEDRAVLMRIVNREHKFFKIEKNDTVIFSSSAIPGNERAIQNLKDNFCRQGAKVIHYKMMDIHAGGHAHQEDLKILYNLVKPKFFIPICGQYSMLQTHAELIVSMGMPKENALVVSNGQMVEVNRHKMQITNQEVPSNYVMVDGLGVGDVSDVVLRDRNLLSQDGVIAIVVMIDAQSGTLKGEPEIISRGFAFLRGKDFIGEINNLVHDIIQKTVVKDTSMNWIYVKDNLRDKIGEFIFKRTERRPMILPFIVEM